ncbi:MAG: S8 family peptidase [Solirubrobacteraceae bacterium]
MASNPPPLPHFLVHDRAEDRDFHRQGRGDHRIRDVDARAHGQALRRELQRTIESADAHRSEVPLTQAELQALGVVIVLEGADAAYPLKLESLDRLSTHTKQAKRPVWLLLSVTEATEHEPERAMVWVSDEYRARFLTLFEDYLEKTTRTGHPRNRELVANIGRIRAAVLSDLWQSSGAPPATGDQWWELWLQPNDAAVDLTREYAQERSLVMAEHSLALNDRTVVWVRSPWAELEDLPFTAVPLTEIRRPEFADTIEDLSNEQEDELAQDLAARITPTSDVAAPVVCHLDTGVRRSHALLSGSLAASDVHTVVSGNPGDVRNHGTRMAGLSLFGPLDALLLGGQPIALRHRLESVKLLPNPGRVHDRRAYGLMTAQAVAMPEATATRLRVFSMQVGAPPDRGEGEPTLWSASVDALAAGVDIAAAPNGIALLGAPNSDASRLFMVSAGNVRWPHYEADYRTRCDLSPAKDPAQAWNALTVGAYTELTSVPSDPSYAGWSALGAAGDVSPLSRTSVGFNHRLWPIKPDICMEGGNVLTDGAGAFEPGLSVLSVRTTDARHDLALGPANATSAATAQAARLAALVLVSYPSYWPETVRGLLVHAAEWTPAMRAELDGAANKTQRLALLRRYGWGVPTENTTLRSTAQAVTMVTQDEFVPFDGEEYRARRFRLHRLPWPIEVLRALGAADVTLKITLSYFIEPIASRRGWRRRYSYASHGLRFELKAPAETVDDFVARVNQEARAEEEGGSRPSSGSDRWLVGPNQRNVGSLHQDIWEGSGAALAEAGMIAVYPVGGWWKNAKNKSRIDRPVRYALLVSLKTTEQGIDLYTPIATQLSLPIPTQIPAT